MTATIARSSLAYVAHPMTSYATPWAARALAAIATALPGVELIDPEAMGWRTNADWLAAWDGIVEAIDVLVIVAAGDGSIGAGCLRELADALAVGVPVAVLGPEQTLCALGGLDLLDEGERTPRRVAILRVGKALG